MIQVVLGIGICGGVALVESKNIGLFQRVASDCTPNAALSLRHQVHEPASSKGSPFGGGTKCFHAKRAIRALKSPSLLTLTSVPACTIMVSILARTANFVPKGHLCRNQFLERQPQLVQICQFQLFEHLERDTSLAAILTSLSLHATPPSSTRVCTVFDTVWSYSDAHAHRCHVPNSLNHAQSTSSAKSEAAQSCVRAWSPFCMHTLCVHL